MSDEEPSPEALNGLPLAVAVELLGACSLSGAQAAAVAQQRPFASAEAAQAAMRAGWDALGEAGWVAAYGAHGWLGDARRGGGRAERWRRAEQRALREVDELGWTVLRGLEERYRRKHGFAFVVCVEGRDAGEVLEVLKERVANETEQEVFEAGVEHVRIMEGRLRKALVEAEEMYGEHAQESD